MSTKTVRAIAVRGFLAGPGDPVNVGEEIELSENDFRTLKYQGRVRPAPEKKKAGRPKKDKAD